MNVSGDIDATMEFNQTSRKWTATFNANAAGSMTIQISGTGNYTIIHAPIRMITVDTTLMTRRLKILLWHSAAAAQR
ncbi:DUF5114 domain-containing protein [Bacteroides sp. CR5/BHMF/2]|nr:DUF5114 domain-containing protein [Bacteroides sp. CR5/BHMF/2]